MKGLACTLAWLLPLLLPASALGFDPYCRPGSELCNQRLDHAIPGFDENSMCKNPLDLGNGSLVFFCGNSMGTGVTLFDLEYRYARSWQTGDYVVEFIGAVRNPIGDLVLVQERKAYLLRASGEVVPMEGLEVIAAFEHKGTFYLHHRAGKPPTIPGVQFIDWSSHEHASDLVCVARLDHDLLPVAAVPLASGKELIPTRIEVGEREPVFELLSTEVFTGGHPARRSWACPGAGIAPPVDASAADVVMSFDGRSFGAVRADHDGFADFRVQRFATTGRLGAYGWSIVRWRETALLTPLGFLQLPGWLHAATAPDGRVWLLSLINYTTQGFASAAEAKRWIRRYYPYWKPSIPPELQMVEGVR